MGAPKPKIQKPDPVIPQVTPAVSETNYANSAPVDGSGLLKIRAYAAARNKRVSSFNLGSSATGGLAGAGIAINRNI